MWFVISISELERYQSKKLSERYKAATIIRHIQTIKHVYSKAFNWKLINEETLKQVRRCKLLKLNNQKLRYLSKEECNLLIS
ncbi:MAG: hypothetical protein N3A62_07510 [Thermodesulfovibrionales bacterium]|nr:hypothetical protein [Thermodesulfovibrionales bacterium]